MKKDYRSYFYDQCMLIYNFIFLFLIFEEMTQISSTDKFKQIKIKLSIKMSTINVFKLK